MRKSVLRRLINRPIHLLARVCPGAVTIRPFLHKMRGVQLHGKVWIGDDAYIENEYPEEVEMHDGASVGMRAMILAHTRGPGKVVLEKNSFVGPGAIIICSSGRTLRVGEGAVISAGSVVMSNVAPGALIAPPRAKPVARATIPFNLASSVSEFIDGLRPLPSKPKSHSCKPE